MHHHSLPLVSAVGNLVIRRLNFPRYLTRAMKRAEVQKARLKPLLSQDDESEVRQTVALVLTRAGFPEAAQAACANLARMHTLCPLFSTNRAGIAKMLGAAMHSLPLSTWRAVCGESRKVLRMGRRALSDEIPTAPENMPETPFYGPREVESESERRAMIARRANYLRACIAASFQADKSRKRKAARKAQLHYLRVATRALAGFGHGAPDTWQTASARRFAKHAFLQYIARGEQLLTDAALDGVPLCKATAFANERGELKTLAGL